MSKKYEKPLSILGKPIIFLLVLILIQPSFIDQTEASDLSLRSTDEDETSDVRLYMHLPYGTGGSNELLPIPPYEDQQMEARNEIYCYNPHGGVNYDLTIKGNSNAHFEQWFSASGPRTIFIDVTFILSDNNESEIVSGRDNFLIEDTPTRCELDVELTGNDVIINKTRNLYMNMEILASPMAQDLTIYSSSDHPSGLTLTIKDPIKVALRVTDDSEKKMLDIYSIMTTPFEGYNIESYDIRIVGPTEMNDLNIAIAQYPASVGSRSWIWYYGKDDPKPGTYMIYLNATTRQGVTGEDRFEFVLEKNDQDPGSGDERTAVIIFLIILLILIIVVIIYFKRRIGKAER